MKSHVSMEQHQCPVCLTLFNTGAILLDKRLNKSLEPNTVTGRSLCPSCNTKLFAEGYVALIEADERTRERKSRFLFLRGEVWPTIFSVAIPEGRICMVPTEIVVALSQYADDHQG